ncbi:MAG TPA: hypothetical protein V6C63_04220, partial [Allocoleopsis sp.]
MMELNSKMQIALKVAGGLVGSLALSLPIAMPQAIAQTRSLVNPCPRIYYEEPYNSTRLVPSGCQANAFTQNANVTGSTNNQLYRINPSTTLPGTSAGSVGTTAPAQPPLPETL